MAKIGIALADLEASFSKFYDTFLDAGLQLREGIEDNSTIISTKTCVLTPH